MDPDARSEGGFSDQLSAEFEKHAERLRERSRARRDAVKLRAPVLDREDHEQVSEAASLGKWQPQDELQGDVNVRTLRSLLKMIDERGFERSAHQLRFHSAFERSTARVLYREVRQKMIQHAFHDLLFTALTLPVDACDFRTGAPKGQPS
jgi:hypothetical protein